jgi:hypothetical protein
MTEKKDGDLPRFGKLATLPWIKISPDRAPTERDDRAGDVVYGVRTAKELREAGRRLAKKIAG